jgi:hypothetical protein
MPNYMLLLYDDPKEFAKMPPEKAQEAMGKYMAWVQKPFVVDAKRLGIDAGRVIRIRNGEPAVTDGPYSETKEMLGGYYTIQAANYDEAVKLAMEHPHVEYRAGTVEIRQTWTE